MKSIKNLFSGTWICRILKGLPSSYAAAENLCSLESNGKIFVNIIRDWSALLRRPAHYTHVANTST